ncbi:unnamed protein product [Angiostrongylus costaricensis]|uniref:Reverse transcriptase domain-containing protein n=1 Tax=Angiostrongylus costaricensis TaxID=334426 RepID=A0A158PH99_ANGCS|nr:unnamed protein product [Angiostrongylus costaricensis]
MLDDFDKACGKIGLRLNLAKTMFVKNGLVSHAPFTLNGTNISECSSYIYLSREVNMISSRAEQKETKDLGSSQDHRGCTEENKEHPTPCPPFRFNGCCLQEYTDMDSLEGILHDRVHNKKWFTARGVTAISKMTGLNADAIAKIIGVVILFWLMGQNAWIVCNGIAVVVPFLLTFAFPEERPPVENMRVYWYDVISFSVIHSVT